jgi:hypothetical protein
MAPVLPNIVDVLHPRFWTGIIRDLPMPTEMIFADGVLQERDVPSDKLEWDILKQDNPMASFVAIGAESPRVLPPDVIAHAWANSLYIRGKETLDEGDLRALRAFGDAPDASLQGAMAAKARANLLRVASRLKNAVAARRNWLAVNALLGDVNVTDGQVRFRMQYPVISVTANPLWSSVSDSDPTLDIETWFKDLRYTPTRAYMSRQTMFNLIRNAKLKTAMAWDSGSVVSAPAVIARERVRQWFAAQLGLNVTITDAVYTTSVDNGEPVNNLTTTEVNYLPTNKVIILPDEPVGYLATTPALLNNFQPGFFSWTVDPTAPGAVKDPPVYELGAGWYGFPVIEYPNKIMVVTVA